MEQDETVMTEPAAPENVTKIRNVTHVHMGGGFWLFMTVCVLCLTAFWTLVGMNYVSLDLVHGKAPQVVRTEPNIKTNQAR